MSSFSFSFDFVRCERAWLNCTELFHKQQDLSPMLEFHLADLRIRVWIMIILIVYNVLPTIWILFLSANKNTPSRKFVSEIFFSFWAPPLHLYWLIAFIPVGEIHTYNENCNQYHVFSIAFPWWSAMSKRVFTVFLMFVNLFNFIQCTVGKDDWSVKTLKCWMLTRENSVSWSLFVSHSVSPSTSLSLGHDLLLSVGKRCRPQNTAFSSLWLALEGNTIGIWHYNKIVHFPLSTLCSMFSTVLQNFLIPSC